MKIYLVKAEDGLYLQLGGHRPRLNGQNKLIQSERDVVVPLTQAEYAKNFEPRPADKKYAFVSKVKFVPESFRAFLVDVYEKPCRMPTLEERAQTIVRNASKRGCLKTLSRPVAEGAIDPARTIFVAALSETMKSLKLLHAVDLEGTELSDAVIEQGRGEFTLKVKDRDCQIETLRFRYNRGRVIRIDW